MNIRDYVKKFNYTYQTVYSNFRSDFDKLKKEESVWLGNLEDKIHLLKNKKDESKIKEVIDKLKKQEVFTIEDNNLLSLFTRKINSIIFIANRVNNFKEGTTLDNNESLKLFRLFNELMKASRYENLNFTLNSNLNTFLPHLYSIVKHCQIPNQYPIYYKYWRNIISEVLNKEDDYDNICEFYREFPNENRHLNFGTYLGTIGIQISRNIKKDYPDITLNSKEYKYLVKNVINIDRYKSILDQSILNKTNRVTNNMKEEFEFYLKQNNKKGSQKARSYIRAIELLDKILNSKAKQMLKGVNSIYETNSIELISNIYNYILIEQNNEDGVFKNEEPASYWKNGFYSAALKSYNDFLKQKKNAVNSIINTHKPFSLSQFEKSLKIAGLNYNQQLITRYIASLATKPFVLLSGLSGSGKTKLAQAFAQWIAEDENQYCIVPVGADWTNREPLLGYVNALDNNEYILPENGALKLLIEANKEDNKNKPYFLILDEMNLSHVERYFADFLSIMESKNQLKLHSDTETKGIVNSHLNWPKNLFIVGTVNIDETTYMFSPKVLDRANVIEFRVNKDDISKFLDSPTEIDFTNLNGKGAGMGESFINIASNKDFNTVDTKALNTKLILFFEELKKTGAEFGYRTATEIHRLYNQLSNLDSDMPENDKIDIAIMQKLLPKLHGSRRKLCPILETLASFCVVDNTNVLKVFFNNKEAINFKNDSVLYPLSLEKITRMYKSAVDNGFASYAEA